MNPEQIEEIKRLRALNLSPKQIARKLGVRPAEVSEYLQKTAEETAIASAEKGELPPLERCLINENAAIRLLDTGKKGWFGQERKQKLENDGTEGMAQIFVIRKEKSRYLLCSFLVDYWCLGVKETIGPRKVDRLEIEFMIEQCSSGFEQKFREIGLEQARGIVYSAVEYAAGLGLQPARDFEKVKDYLGQREESDPKIECGRDGKPCFICGPYDNQMKILGKLRESVGEGNFSYILPV
ncbi:DNA-binding response regulator [Pannus brasiliensis CCIBt3594]|uniref:DNA-binding response regulator n=1 Tax=Pannus brasiliensis CCIBt3594 TaxID=1427578 RepID=A0AAW9QSI3_9CHRO